MKLKYFFLLALVSLLPRWSQAQCPKVVQTAVIGVTGTGDATIIASDPGRVTYVWQFFMVNSHASTDVNVTLKAGATSISGAYLLKAGGGSQVGPCTGTPWAIIPAGSTFIINTSASGSLQGTVYYTQQQS